MSLLSTLLSALSGNLFIIRGGSRTAATSKMERFMIIVNGWKRFVIIVNGWNSLSRLTNYLNDSEKKTKKNLMFNVISTMSISIDVSL